MKLIGYIKNKKFKASLKNQAGFTLIEMIAAMVLLGIMGLFSTQFISGAAESNRLVSGQKGLLDDAKLAMEFMIREIRVANTDPTNSGADIQVTGTSGSHSIAFTKFFGLSVDAATAVTYSRVGNNIQRQTSTATTVLASQVNDFTITESSTDFYEITIGLAGPNGENFILRSGVRPRSTTS